MCSPSSRPAGPAAGWTCSRWATVTRSIIDNGRELYDGAEVGDDSAALDDPDAIAIVGRECKVSTRQKPGARLAPGTTA